MNKPITTSGRAITPAKSFADLELVPLQRQGPRRTGLEELFAAVYRQRFVVMVALSGVITKFYARSAGVRYGGHDYYTYGHAS